MDSKGPPADLYLDLMKKCVTNWIYGAEEKARYIPGGFFKRMIAKAIESRGVEIVYPRPMNAQLRSLGEDRKQYARSSPAHTMIGLRRLDNIQYCIESALSSNTPGDMIECGVWRGGAAIFMRAVLRAHAITDRVVWVADSFEGCPIPNEERYPADKGDAFHRDRYLAVSLEQVKANFDKYGLLDDQVHFLKGWFRDSLPGSGIEQLAVLRLDGDLYESTMDSLVNLYPRLSRGGYVIVDDFHTVPACKKAVCDYREMHRIADKIEEVDQDSVYWRRS
jgi:hypothetical protein